MVIAKHNLLLNVDRSMVKLIFTTLTTISKCLPTLPVFQKIWQETRSLSKKEIVDRCFEMCSVNNVVKSRSSTNSIVIGYDHHQIHIQKNFSDLVKVYSAKKDNASAHEKVTTTVGNQSDDDADIILQHLPPELVEKLDTNSLAMIRSAPQIVSISSNANEEEPTPAENEKNELSTIRCSEFYISTKQISLIQLKASYLQCWKQLKV